MRRPRPHYKGMFRVDTREPMTSPRNREHTRKALGVRRWLRNRRATRKTLAMRQRTRELGERRILECRYESAVKRARVYGPGGAGVVRPDVETEALWDAVDAAGKLLRLERR